MDWNELWSQPLSGVALTVALYAAASAAGRRYRRLHPLLLCSGSLIAVLIVFDIPYESYNKGGSLISFLLGPATVALAVPLYRHWRTIRSQWRPIVIGVVSGAAFSLAANAWLAYAFGGSRELLLTMLPKSTTAPIAIELVRMYGGIPELGAVFTVLTGLLGSLVGVSFLRLIGVKCDLPIGIAIGTAAHGIGTARVLRDSELQGAYAGLAMGLTGVIMSVLSVPIYYWLIR